MRYWGQTNVGKTDLWLAKKFELRLIDGSTDLYCSIFSCCFSFFKAKQRAGFFSPRRFFSEQQEQTDRRQSPERTVTQVNLLKPWPTLLVSVREKVEEKPPPAPTIATKPIRAGPIKPQAIKTEETNLTKSQVIAEVERGGKRENEVRQYSQPKG